MTHIIIYKDILKIIYIIDIYTMSRSSFPRNISGNQQVEITNFKEAPTIVKAQTDITKPDTITPLLCNSQGKLEVSTNLTSGLRTFTNGTDPSEAVASSLDKNEIVMAGCDNVNTSFSSINPIRVDSNGNLQVNINNKQDVLSFTNALWTSGSFTNIFDCSSASKIRLYGNVGTTDTLQIQYASAVSSGVYDWIFSTEVVPITTIDGSICIDMVIDCPPPFIRIKNNSASTQSVSLRVVKH